MTKEITKANILQELEDRFGLREFVPAKFLLDETVIPTYEISGHLQKWRTDWEDVSIISTGGKPVVTVPANERWKIRSYVVVFYTGTYTIAGAYILRLNRKDDTDFSYLDLTAGQSVSYLRTLPEAVTLEPGDALKINVDGYTATGYVRVFYDYQVSELR